MSNKLFVWKQDKSSDIEQHPPTALNEGGGYKAN